MSDRIVPSSIVNFPHYDRRVLHAPGECRYCEPCLNRHVVDDSRKLK